MHLPRFIFALQFSAILYPSDANGQVEPDTGRSIPAVRATKPIKIDGSITEGVWQRAGETSFIQRQPDEGAPASQKTEAWVAYDEDALYVAVKLYDSHPDSIIGRLARRDRTRNPM